MRKMNTVLLNNNQLSALTNNVNAHQQLQQLWRAAAPAMLADNSFVGNIINSQIVVYADSAIVANKIKLMQASLLTQLANLQKNNHKFSDCKVTAINVKVQVKSRPKIIPKASRILSNNAANNLANFAQTLLAKNKGDSLLATKLKALAEKTK